MQDTALKQMRLSQLFVLALNINMFYNKKNRSGQAWKEHANANGKTKRGKGLVSFACAGMDSGALYNLYALRDTALF